MPGIIWRHNLRRQDWKGRILQVCVASFPVLTAVACGSGTGGSQLLPVSSTISSISLDCTPAAVAPGTTSQCAATVQGTGSYNSTVTWLASAGSINASGLFTAPASPGTVTVKATSTQDPTKSGTASLNVQSAAPTITSLAVLCTPAALAPGATSQCAATVHGTGSYSSTVTWSASAGSVNTSGLFTAPASPGPATVKATSTQDPTKSGTASLNVQSVPAITSVAVTCNPSAIAPSAASQCTAAVQGTGSYSSSVTWSASTGNISANGLFTAPALAGSATIQATSTQDPTRSGTAAVIVRLQTPLSQHLVLVMEENQSYATVVHNTTDWPNLNNLISNGALPTNYYASSHPSIGNYFMLTTGQILTGNDNSTTVWNVDSIARRMLAAGVSFKIYAEGITRGYVGGNTGLYLLRHDPFAMLSDIADNSQVANQCIWPFTQFAADMADGTLPEFSFIVPDIEDDAHNGTPHQADSWLQSNVVIPLSNDSAFAPGGDGILIVEFDEAAGSDTANGGGHVSPVFWGPNVRAGYTQSSATLYQHPSMLRTIMEALQLPNPPASAAAAPSMAEFFVQK